MKSRDHLIGFRVDGLERAHIERAATNLDCSVSEYVRGAAVNIARKLRTQTENEEETDE